MSAIRRVPKKKRSKSVVARRPAPWNCPPEPVAQGPRFFPEAWVEAADVEAAHRLAGTTTPRRFPIGERGVRVGPYANDLYNGDHLQSDSEYKEQTRGMKRYNLALNRSIESAMLPDTTHAEGRRSGLVTDCFELPWRAPPASPHKLETDSGRPRGLRAGPRLHLESSVHIDHDGSIKPRPLRVAGLSLSHEARMMSCFESGTCVRGHPPFPGEAHRLRPPYGTAYNYSFYEPFRKHTVHYDTRDLLTFAA